MTKIARKTQQVFGGSLVAANNIAQFGSLKLGTPVYSLDPASIQTTAYLNGWAAAVVNNNAPALQDMNALFYLMSYQLGYVMQAGVPEWDSGTTYYKGSLVQAQDGSANGLGILFVSQIDSNTSALTVKAAWRLASPGRAWNANITYHTGDTATSTDGATTYVCIADSTMVALTTAANWRPIVQTGVSSLIGAGSSDIDAQTGNAFRKTGSASATNIGLVNMYEGQTIVVNVESVASQAAITWKRGTNSGGTADIKWANAVIPTPTTSASRVDRYVFQMLNGVIYGSADMNCY